jgi:hypothetical protein
VVSTGASIVAVLEFGQSTASMKLSIHIKIFQLHFERLKFLKLRTQRPGVKFRHMINYFYTEAKRSHLEVTARVSCEKSYVVKKCYVGPVTIYVC